MAVRQLITKATSTFGPASNLTATWGGDGLGWVLSWAQSTLARGYRVYRQSLSDTTEQPNSLDLKIRLNELRILGTTFADKLEPQELEQYTYTVVALDKDDVESTPVSVTVTTPKVAAQNNLLLFSEDLTNSKWVIDTGITVTNQGATNGCLLSFGAANRAISQLIPTLPQVNRTYTFGIEVKGTAGEAVSMFMHSDYNAGVIYTMPSNVVLTGNWQWVIFSRTTGNNPNDRYIRAGIQSFNSATALTMSVRKTRMGYYATVPTDAQFIADYETTVGLGTTWQEAIRFYEDPVGAYSGWHKNTSVNNIPAIMPFSNLTLNGARTRSVADHISCTGGSVSVSVKNHRAYGLPPVVQGGMRGLFVRLDYSARMNIENNYVYRTAGTSLQNLRGVNVDGAYTHKNNFYRELDGRMYNLNGTPIQSSWNSLHSNIWPDSIGPGRGIACMYGIHQIESASAAGVLNPTGAGIINGENSYNLLIGRPGFTCHEDFYNYSGIKGTATSLFRTHHNAVMSSPQPDYAFYARGLTGTYNQGRILTPYTLTVTTNAAVAAGGTSIPVVALTGPIPPNTTLVFGGVSVITSGETVKSSTSITTTVAISAAIGTGLAWSGTLNWGPSIVSSSGGLVTDGIMNSWEGQSQYHEQYANLAIGEELLIADLGAGSDRNTYCNEVYMPATLLNGTVIGSRSRDYAYQSTNYANPKTSTQLDKNGVAQTLYQRIGFYANMQFGGTYIFDGGDSTKTYGATKYTVPTIAECWTRLGRWRTDAVNAGIVIGPGVTADVVVAPSNPNILNDGDAFTVSWTTVAGATYCIKRSDGTGRQYVQIAPVQSGTSYKDSTVYDGGTPSYRIFSVINNVQSLILEVGGLQPNRVWSGPITATNNQVLTGNYRSLDRTINAITIPANVTGVVINGARIASRRNGIEVTNGASVTVTNSVGWGLHPGIAASHNGVFINSSFSNSIVFENNYGADWWFIGYCLANGGTSYQKIKMRFNRSRNMQGRTTNATGYELIRDNVDNVAHAYQMNQVNKCPDIEIAYNELIQEEGIGFVEDIINMYTTSGLDDNRPWRVHDNLVRGGYAITPDSANHTGNTLNSSAYSGTGIIIDGAVGADITAFSYGQIWNNYVVGLSNGGISAAAGNYMEIWRNRTTSCGLTPSGKVQYAMNSGMHVWKQYSGVMSNVNVHDNAVSFVNKEGSINKAIGTGDYNNQSFTPSLSAVDKIVYTNNDTNTANNGYPLFSHEVQEHYDWWMKMSGKGLLIGPNTNNNKRGRVVFVTDDGFKEAFTTNIRPLFNSKGMKYTEALITNNINGNGLTTAQVQQLIAEGHGVISHTQGHANVSTTLATSEAALRADLLGSKNAIEAITGVKVESFVYPSGDRNAATDVIVKDYYDYGIAVGGDTNIDISGGRYDMKYAYMNLTRCAIGQYYDGSGGWKDVAGVRYYGSNAGTDTFSNAGGTLNTSSLEYYKARVKEANDNHDFLIFMLHGYGGNYAPGATQANYLGAVLDYIKTLNIDTTVLR